ncbi:conserved hypothetical protein [Gammaproteobacteria bacterium]
MLKAYTTKELQDFFQLLEAEYDVQIPIKLHDNTRTLGKIGEGEMALLGGVLPMKPTGVFAPYQEVILTFEGEEIKLPRAPKPIFVVGFTAADAACLEFIDRFYQKNFADGPYLAKRNNSVIVCITGKCGVDGTLLPIAGSNCDLELIYDGEKFIALAYSDIGKKLTNRVFGGTEVADDKIAKLKEAAEKLSNSETEMLQAASKLILENKVPEYFWQKISNRCITCTGCTLVCPTCTCFDVFDRKTSSDQKTERVRIRDSCQLGGFMYEASGHNPMGKEFQRTRRRIHHKLAADVIRFGHITCFNCGRCDQVCPSNIGIKSVCREMVSEFG